MCIPFRASLLAASIVVASIQGPASLASADPPARTDAWPGVLAAPSTPESHLEAARALLRLSTTQATVDAIIEMMARAMSAAQPLIAEHDAAFRRVMARIMTVDSMIEALAPIYVAEFSELEIRQMTWFQSTPTGRHMVAAMPSVMARGGDVGRQLVQAYGDRLPAMFEEEVARESAPRSQSRSERRQR